MRHLQRQLSITQLGNDAVLIGFIAGPLVAKPADQKQLQEQLNYDE